MPVKTEKVAAETPVQQPAVERKKSTARDYFESLVVTVILALFGTTFVIQAFKIPSSSMEDSLLIGDHLMVDKLAYAPPTRWMAGVLPYHDIRRGDIVVFKYPINPATHFVKRVIGLPGDRIRIVRRQVIVNGRMLDEGYKVHKTGTIEDYRDNFPGPLLGPVLPQWAEDLPSHVKDGWLVVPEGHYFVMGDNRDFSSDSRYWGWVPRENILGKPLVIYWSLESTSKDYQSTGVVDRVVGVFEILIDFPRRTRWSRMFRIIHGAQP